MLQLDSLTLRVGTRVLIDQQTLRTPHRARIGLIGHNGAGKSSLLRLIRGELSADSGHFGLAGKPVIASMAQETPALECSALDHLLDTNREFRELERRMAEAPDDANLHTRFNDIEGWSQPAKAAELLAGLGFDQDRQAQPVSALSGGWRMRLNLARALFQASELLLLDEPTNHLDIDAITWLEKVLARYPGTLVLVAHDRAFLDSVCSHVLALDDQQLKLYSGGYSEFERQRAAEIERQSAEQAKTNRKRAHLQSFVDRFKAKASKAKQAQSRVKAMEKLVVSAAVRSRSPLNFNIPSSDKLSTPLVAGSDLTLGYPDADIVRGAHLSLNPGDRVGLLGVNGAGKSTLVKTLVGKLKPKAGTLHPGQNTKMGYFAQEQLDTLRADSVPLAELVRIAPTTRELELRNFLGGWGFGADRIDQPITALSGGERARLALSLIAWQKPNLLILDEPTNHLDLDARAALAEALVEFPGALLLVSHDRHLLETTCDQLWSLRGGTLSVWTQALEDWVDDSPRQGSQSTTSDNSQKEQRRNRAAQRTQLAPLRKAVKSAEGEMEKLQVQLKRIDQTQAEPGYFTDTPLAQQTEHGQARARLLDALDDAEMVWLEASEALEDAS